MTPDEMCPNCVTPWKCNGSHTLPAKPTRWLRDVLCPYCGKKAAMVGGVEIYPHRPDLREKKFYQCAPCDAYVGCHPGTTNALGRLANAELRAAKIAAHTAFDPLWKGGEKTRSSAYAWLADATGIDKKDCHIGRMDVADCHRVVDACNGRKVINGERLK